MEQTPSLSIIVPAYNVERFLDKCLASICAQTYRDFEVILINDGATDSTPQICERWAAKDTRIRLINQENQGLAVVRNVGLELARAPYILFIDSDDFIEPNSLEELFHCKEKYGADIVIGNYVYEDIDGNALPETDPVELKDGLLSARDALRLILYDRHFKSFAWMRIFDKTLFDGITFPAGALLEDYQTIYKVIARSRKGVAILSKPLYHYVQQGGSILNNNKTRFRAHTTWIHAMVDRCDYALQSPLLTKKEKYIFWTTIVKKLLHEWKNDKTLVRALKRARETGELYVTYQGYQEDARAALVHLYGLEPTPWRYHWIRWGFFFKRAFVRVFYR